MSVNIKTQSGLKRFAGNTISTTATPLMSGLMSAEDKQKLDSIGGIGVEKTLIAWGQGVKYANYEELKNYDFIYMQSGSDYCNEREALYAGLDILFPSFVLWSFVDTESEETVVNASNFSGSYHLSCMYSNAEEHTFVFETNDDYIGVWGLKLKGQTASGGKSLIIDSDSAEAETYTIVGSEDATLLNLEMYGEVGSTRGTGAYLIYSNGTRGTSSAITTLGTTLITYSMASTGTLTIGKKANVKLKVWAEGVGYTVNKQ